MPVFYIAPAFRREGVVSGFVLAPQTTTVWDSVDVTTGYDVETGDPIIETTSVPRETGSLTPLVSPGVLFAQDIMWRPAAPVAPAAPANARSYLHYQTGSGFYWSGLEAGSTAGDATIGWVVTDGAGVVACSSRREGRGEFDLSLLQPHGGESDGVRTAPAFGVEVSALDPTVAEVTGLTFTGAKAIEAAVFTFFYVNAAAPLTTLAADLGTGDASATLASGAGIAAGDYLQVGRELVLCGTPAGGVVPITRAQLGSLVDSAAAGASVYKAQKRSVTAALPADFATSDAASSWALFQALPEMRLAAVSGYVVSAFGASASAVVCVTDNGDHGLPLTSPAAGATADTVVSVTNANATLAAVQQIVHVVATTVNCTLNLPADAAMAGHRITAFLASGSTHTEILHPAGTDTINGASGNYTVTEAGSSITIEATGTGDWLIVSSAGSLSAAAPADAPNVTDATAVVNWEPYGHDWKWFASGVITLPTGSADFDHLKEIDPILIGPDGQSVALPPIYAAQFSGATIAYKGLGIPISDYAARTYTLKFWVKNENGVATAAPVTKTVTVTPPSVASVAAAEAGGARVADENRGLTTTINVTPTLAGAVGAKQDVTVWADFADGAGFRSLGWRTVVGSSSVVTFPGVWVPTAASATTVTVKCIVGAVSGDVPPAGAAVTTFVFAGPSAPTANEASHAYVASVTYAAGPGGAKWFSWVIHTDLPFSNPEFKGARWTLQTGSLVGGVLTPGGAHPDETNIADYLLGDFCERLAGTDTVVLRNQGPWGVPSDGNTCHRLKVYVNSQLNSDGSGGVKTQQNAWSSGVGVSTPGTAAFQDMVVDGTLSQSDARLIDPTTLGSGLTKAPGGKPQIIPTTNQLLNWSFEAGADFPQWEKSASGPPLYWSTESESAGGHSFAVGFGNDGYLIQFGNNNPLPVHMDEQWFMAMRYKRAVAAGYLRYRIITHAADTTTTGNFVLEEASASVGWTTKSQVLAVPAGSAYIEVVLQTVGQTGGDSYVDWVHLERQPSTGDGTQPDGKGGVKFRPGAGLKNGATGAAEVKIDPAAPVTVDGSGNVTLKLSSGLGTDGSGNLKVKNGQTVTFDASGNVVVNAGPGLTINAGGALVPNQGATVGVNPSGQLIVPAGSLGLTQFGGAYQPYGFYFGLPSPSDASVPKLIINTADWKIYRNTGGAWSKQADPADLIAGTITALVSLISPSISGGSIVGTDYTMTSGSLTININVSGVKVTDSSFSSYAQMTQGAVSVGSTSTPGVSATMQVDPTSAGKVVLRNSSGGGVTVLGTPPASAANSGTAALPASPAGFINVEIGGNAKKVPYYNN